MLAARRRHHDNFINILNTYTISQITKVICFVHDSFFFVIVITNYWNCSNWFTINDGTDDLFSINDSVLRFIKQVDAKAWAVDSGYTETVERPMRVIAPGR